MSKAVRRELAETAATLPIHSALADLFTDEKMFDSYDRFADAGFDLVDHNPRKIMSGSHKRAPGYLFKKYNNDRSGEEQLRNYMLRIEGARRLRSFITDQRFTATIAPRKWLYELPSDFPERYLVIAEKLDLASKAATKSSYESMGEGQVRELATILYYFRGLSSTASNLPFTKDGKIAFVDTERWDHDKDFLHKVDRRLSRAQRKIAEDVYDELRGQGADRYRSDDDAFEWEESTSSS